MHEIYKNVYIPIYFWYAFRFDIQMEYQTQHVNVFWFVLKSNILIINDGN